MPSAVIVAPRSLVKAPNDEEVSSEEKNGKRATRGGFLGGGRGEPVPSSRARHPFEVLEMDLSLPSPYPLNPPGTAALEEDAQILRVIEAYCASANFQPGHGSSRLPPPRHFLF